jgi:hypothetical protein
MVDVSDRRRLAARLVLLLVGSPLCCAPLLLLNPPLVSAIGGFVGSLAGVALFWLGA